VIIKLTNSEAFFYPQLISIRLKCKACYGCAAARESHVRDSSDQLALICRKAIRQIAVNGRRAA
jgi:hypothetical protein